MHKLSLYYAPDSCKFTFWFSLPFFLSLVNILVVFTNFTIGLEKLTKKSCGSKYDWGIPFETQIKTLGIPYLIFSLIKPKISPKFFSFFHVKWHKLSSTLIYLEYLLFSLMKIKIIKFIQCEPCSINEYQFLKFSFFETLYIVIGHLILVTFKCFIHINT